MAKVKALLLGESEKAYKIQQTVRRENIIAWIPKSQVDHISKHPVAADGLREVNLTIPDWLADDKGLDSY